MLQKAFDDGLIFISWDIKTPSHDVSVASRKKNVYDIYDITRYRIVDLTISPPKLQYSKFVVPDITHTITFVYETFRDVFLPSSHLYTHGTHINRMADVTNAIDTYFVSILEIF